MAFALWLALVVACAPAGQRDTVERAALEEYHWLLGTYHGVGEGIEFFEAYRLQDDSTIVIDYFTDATMTERQPVTGTVVSRSGEIYHTYGDMRWHAHERSPDTLRFAPDAGATNLVDWIREGDGEWHAVLYERDADGREMPQRYVLRRVP